MLRSPDPVGKSKKLSLLQESAPQHTLTHTYIGGIVVSTRMTHREELCCITTILVDINSIACVQNSPAWRALKTERKTCVCGGSMVEEKKSS